MSIHQPRGDISKHCWNCQRKKSEHIRHGKKLYCPDEEGKRAMQRDGIRGVAA